MSAVPPSAGSLVARWSKAIWRPSGDQSKLPTTNVPVVSVLRRLRRDVEDVEVRVAVVLVFDLDVAPALLAFLHRRRTPARSSCRRASLPSGDHAKLLTPSSALVSVSASPPRQRNAVDLPLAVAVRHEREPRAVGRQRRLAARLLRVRQLARRPVGASASQISVSYAFSSQLVSRMVNATSCPFGAMAGAPTRFRLIRSSIDGAAADCAPGAGAVDDHAEDRQTPRELGRPLDLDIIPRLLTRVQGGSIVFSVGPAKAAQPSFFKEF